MATNDMVHINVTLIEREAAEEYEAYFIRLGAAHFIEAVDRMVATRKRWPGVDEFVNSLSAQTRTRYDALAQFADRSHPLRKRLERSRHTLFHYPKVDPGADAAGQEELANAMDAVADEIGSFEAGEDYASFRARFADTIGLRLVADSVDDARALWADLQEPMFGLVDFTERVLMTYLPKPDDPRIKVFGPSRLFDPDV